MQEKGTQSYTPIRLTKVAQLTGRERKERRKGINYVNIYIIGVFISLAANQEDAKDITLALD